MKTIQVTQLTATYANRGQHLEQCVRYTLMGEIAKADNLPATAGADCLGYQIKSARATICKGTDIKSHLATDKATAYMYITADYVGYIMSKQEYLEFASTFGTLTKESTKNGGAVKVRFKSEGKALLNYLRERA